MDGYKKIKGIVFAGAIAFAITACKVQAPTYISLYADNLISENDTVAYISETFPDIPDTSDSVDKGSINDLLYSKEIINDSSDSIYKYEVKEMLKSIADSIQLFHQQLIELSKQLTLMPDTCSKRIKPQVLKYADTTQSELSYEQLIRKKNDTINMLLNKVREIQEYADQKADTIYFTKKTASNFKADSIKTAIEINAKLQSKNDTILTLRKRVNQLQNSGITRRDTVYIVKAPSVTSVSESQQTDRITQQLLKAKDDQIQILQNRLNEMQAAANKTSQQPQTATTQQQAKPMVSQPDYSTQQMIIAKDNQIKILQDQLNKLKSKIDTTPEPTKNTIDSAESKSLKNTQDDHSALQLYKEQNDTILFLINKLSNQQLQAQKADTVYINNDLIERQTEKEIIVRQNQPNLKLLQDTIQMLKSRLLAIDEKDINKVAKTDTTLLIAYYLLGDIKPIDEDKLVQQITDLCRSKSVTKITLSGFTDSSGDKYINKEITNQRLNYLFKIISPLVAKDRVFFQNFGDVFASDIIVKDERRVEIRIYTK